MGEVIRVTGETDDHLQVAGSAGWSFARGRILPMIICKRPDPLDDHLQEAGSSRWSFASCRILQMIICKWLGPPDDHLQEARSSGWSFARSRILWMIIYKWPDPPDDHLGWQGWRGWRDRRRRRRKRRRRKNSCTRTDQPKVVQEVLADLKKSSLFHKNIKTEGQHQVRLRGSPLLDLSSVMRFALRLWCFFSSDEYDS